MDNQHLIQPQPPLEEMSPDKQTFQLKNIHVTSAITVCGCVWVCVRSRPW